MFRPVIRQLDICNISRCHSLYVRLNSQLVLALCIFMVSAIASGQSFETSIDYTMHRLATEYNDPSAQYLVGRNYLKGKSVEKDIKEAIKWFEMAAKQDHVRAQYQLGKIYLYGEGIKANLKQAFYYLSKAAEKNHADSQYELGKYYLLGNPNERQYANAVKWFRRAASQDHVRSLYMLGKLLYEGKGVDPDPDEAKQLLRQASESGLLEASNYLAQLQSNAPPTLEGDIAKIQREIDGLSKTQHSPDDYYRHGMAFLTGNFGNNKEQALRKAARYFQKAAEGNHGKAQYQLAKLYQKGIGVEQSDQLHRHWLRKAADAGVQGAIHDLEAEQRKTVLVHRRTESDSEHDPDNDPDHQYILAMKYYQGDGLPIDRGKAADWFSKAAKQDHANAQYQLGLMYRDGTGVKKNLQKARHWLEKAADNNVVAATLALKSISSTDDAATLSGAGANPDHNGALAADNIDSQLIAKNSSPIYSFLKHARDGDHAAQYQVAIKLLKGEDGVKRDVNQAIKWLKTAAQEDYTQATIKLGMLYYQGIDVERDYRSAATWMEKAAHTGDAQAQFMLGNLYRDGLGVEKNNATAIMWYRKAANQGHREARKRLGGCRIC